MTVIATSTVATATAFSNQRKVDRCQNGVLWTLDFGIGTGTTAWKARLKFSTDDGATWSTGTGNDISGVNGTQSHVPNGSLFIDLDDYAHVVYKDRHDGCLYYRRGTPNAGRTAWTWSNPLQLRNGSDFHYPDVVAHREGTGWSVHVVAHRAATALLTHVHYHRIFVSSSGGLTLQTDPTLGIVLSSGYSNNEIRWPSIDFHHTGDGKTVKNGTPHLYVAWAAGAVAHPSLGIRFRKATYSGGSWTWDSEQQAVDYLLNNSNFWINCGFDGVNAIVGGYGYPTSSTRHVFVRLFDADGAIGAFHEYPDTNSNGIFSIPNGSLAVGGGKVYFQGRGTNASDVLTHLTLDLVSGLWSLDQATVTANWVSTRRQANNRLEFVYTNGTSSPYSVTYGAISLNEPPNVPTNVQRTGLGTDNTPNLSAHISDPNTNQQIKARFRIFTEADVLVGTVDSAFRTGAGTVTAEYATALATGKYKVQAKTIDDLGEESAYSAFTNFSITQNVTPTDIVLRWNVKGATQVDLDLLWIVALGNQRDFVLKWDVKERRIKDLDLAWRQRHSWSKVGEDGTEWRRVYQ